MSPHTRAFLLVIAVASVMPAANIYSVTTLAAAQDSLEHYHATGINRAGQVAGFWESTNGALPRHLAFVYTGGVLTYFGYATAAAINDLGQIVGEPYDVLFGGAWDASLYAGGTSTALGSLPGLPMTWASGINDSGQVVGWATDASGDQQAFLYSGGVMTGLGVLPGGTKSWATSVNASGQVAGYATTSSGGFEAFVYTGGTMTGLGFLPGGTSSTATAINDQGQVVGYAGDSSGNTQAFLYANGVMTRLGTLPGDVGSQALAINNKGQIVGYSIAPSGVQRAFLYSGGQMYDLNELVGGQTSHLTGLPVFPQDTLTQAAGINDSGQIIADGAFDTYLLTPMQGRFVPVTPCRIADTRLAPGSFGGPALAGGAARSFPVPESACGIPATAQAYSLNVTVVPQGPLGYLTLWPTGMDQPLVSTLNSFQGSVVANAAIVPSGQDGAVSVYVTDPTDLILDIDGYFDATSGDSFYTVPPCRLADTRLPANSSTDTLHGPSMGDHETRDFPVLSTSCGLPATASAYSTNVTVIPAGLLSFLTTWATGQPQPLVSTLNALNGGIVANAAIVPAGTNGAVSVYVTNKTDVVLDTNGYFAPSGNSRALTFYPVTPCRVADTREADGPFGGPVLKGGTLRSFAIPDSDCSIPATAAAYSLNVTAVPDGPLGFLTAWPTGLPLPFVSTLNSPTGTVTANAAIVPAGANGAISVYVTNQTHVVLDINGYFAP
jgi:probable HAF family extracellular repeat protein